MGNLSHLVIIEDVLRANHLLQNAVDIGGFNIPEDILQLISDLDFACFQFGRYDAVYDELIKEGKI